MATTTSLTNNFRQGLLAGNFDLPADTLNMALYNVCVNCPINE